MTSQSDGTVSEFYKLRRSSITDVTGLIAFVLGWLVSGVIAWPYIKSGFDTGNPTSGVFRFVVVVFAGGIASGIFGMMLGTLGGLVWQKRHQSRRAHVVYADDVQSSATRAATEQKKTSPRAALPALRYTLGEVDAAAFIALAARIGVTITDATHTATALDRTINVCAWNGDTLVGIARILSDGFFYAALADIYVDPELQRRGLGRELMNRAFERTPRGALYVGSPLSASAFFDHVGCDRGSTGFIMHKRSGERGARNES